ncbi:MAG: dihydrofolate reductase [Flavobacteriales bacterium]
MKTILVAAIGEKNELGKDNALLWHLQSDMRFFKELTTGHYVAMGRKSFESIPKKFRPLPNRVNIIISRNPDYMFEECYTCTSLSEATALAEEHGAETLFIIGGGQIYAQALATNRIDEMYITQVQATFEDADVFFPEITQDAWQVACIRTQPSNADNEFPFEILHYVKKAD